MQPSLAIIDASWRLLTQLAALAALFPFRIPSCVPLSNLPLGTFLNNNELSCIDCTFSTPISGPDCCNSCTVLLWGLLSLSSCLSLDTSTEFALTETKSIRGQSLFSSSTHRSLSGFGCANSPPVYPEVHQERYLCQA
jgi:hypothetical protein